MPRRNYTTPKEACAGADTVISMVAHDRDVVFTPQWRLKDVKYALKLTQKLGIGSPFGPLAGNAFRQLCALEFRQENEKTILEVARIQVPDSAGFLVSPLTACGRVSHRLETQRGDDHEKKYDASRPR